ncbi:hypothetical protein HS088_TW04G00358 [Tripterygium wilfordii]|uniref:FLZ-type domain-containing protein n=1 Tax=Tripterygium wilfordii TaxID=458696 RepID=A0A7J7DPY7_TRIWF|nr:FCS-Like Zinc finger 14-like [Tripterygium wilfordii]KAF5748405.1 hypothetical protein HS088_TW04G00358 [Tripterygium wilfordii]
MPGQRTHPVIGKLSELLVSVNRAGLVSETTTSPRSPLDFKAQSPRCGTKCYELGGVGLGIVAALEKPSVKGHGILAKYAVTSPRSSTQWAPIPVYSGRNGGGFDEEIDLENYTYVTCHGPDNKSITKVYYDGGDNVRINVCEVKEKKEKKKSTRSCVDQNMYPVADFLSCCNLCKKQLHGKDIYMYRGEKAFCSPECRSRQIMVDERKEQCRSDAARSADLSSSPYTRDHIFSTGILAI